MQSSERRAGDRRQGERRREPRPGPDRRRGERRGRAAVTHGIVAATCVLAFGAAAEAQIYTRRNANGTIEATNVPDSSDFRLTYPGKGTVIHSKAWRLRPMYNGEYNHHIAEASAEHGVDVQLVRAIIQVESAFDRQAVSSKGAQGLMQLMPPTARRFGVTDAFDARQNIFAGVKYLRILLNMFNGDVNLAAAAYNAGENAVLRYGGIPPYKETRGYVQKVQSLLGGAPAGPTMTSFAPRPVAAPVIPAASYVPNDTRGKTTAAAVSARGRRAKGKAPASVFYRWRDADGVVHVGQNPPVSGVPYSKITAVD